jgi:hypothetical protein
MEIPEQIKTAILIALVSDANMSADKAKQCEYDTRRRIYWEEQEQRSQEAILWLRNNTE